MGFKKVLIANRGEIALRIMRTLRDMGIEAAIIYGKEDRLSLPVQLADDATFRDVINPLDSLSRYRSSGASSQRHGM